MNYSFRNRADAAQFAGELVMRLRSDSQLTMITKVESSEGFCVHIVTDMLSDDIDKIWELIFLDRPMSI